MALLPKIATGEVVRGEKEDKFKLEDKIKDCQADYDEYIGKGKDFFSVLKDEEDENAFNDYKQAYDKFYDSLRLETD